MLRREEDDSCIELLPLLGPGVDATAAPDDEEAPFEARCAGEGRSKVEMIDELIGSGCWLRLLLSFLKPSTLPTVLIFLLLLGPSFPL